MVLKRVQQQSTNSTCSATMADRAVLKHKGGLAPLYSRFSNHGRSGGSQTPGRTQRPHRSFSNHGRSGGSQTAFESLPIRLEFSNHGRSGGSQTTDEACTQRAKFSNHGRSGGSQTRSRRSPFPQRSATMADRAVLKPVGVDMPFDLGIPISKNCKICQVFLFLRPARSFFRSGSRISASVYSRPDGGMDPL